MEGAPQPIPADDLAPPTRSLCEALLERLQADVGHWQVTLDGQDGSLRNVSRLEKRIPASALGRFDREES